MFKAWCWGSLMIGAIVAAAACGRRPAEPPVPEALAPMAGADWDGDEAGNEDGDDHGDRRHL